MSQTPRRVKRWECGTAVSLSSSRARGGSFLSVNDTDFNVGGTTMDNLPLHLNSSFGPASHTLDGVIFQNTDATVTQLTFDLPVEARSRRTTWSSPAHRSAHRFRSVRFARHHIRASRR